MTREEAKAIMCLYAVKTELMTRRMTFEGHESAPITAIDMAIEALSAEAVEVVRCKDCKHYGATDCQIQESFYGIKDFDFCSYGERREDGEA